MTAAIYLLPLASEAHIPRLDLFQKQGKDSVSAVSNWSD